MVQDVELKKENKIDLTMDDAITYLKSIDEWNSASKFDRETILAWANYLKNREETPKKKTKKTLA
jgi:hypothetical protein